MFFRILLGLGEFALDALDADVDLLMGDLLSHHDIPGMNRQRGSVMAGGS